MMRRRGCSRGRLSWELAQVIMTLLLPVVPPSQCPLSLMER